MARIVAVHGIAQQRKGESTLHTEWWPALNDGLARAGHPSLAASDLSCAFYGDLFRPPGSKAVGDPPYDATDIDPEWEGELLEAWVNSAEGNEVSGSSPKTKVAMPRGLQRLAERALELPFFAALSERLLVFDLKQVRSYLFDPEVRREVQHRVEQVVAEDTRVILGHSLGSVVAYEALCAHPEWQVRALITLGSPLGIRNLIFDRLVPAPAGGRGIFPSNLGQWTNIADNGDAVALVKELAPLFGASVRDMRVSNGATAHDVRPYLTARENGGAIAEALRD